MQFCNLLVVSNIYFNQNYTFDKCNNIDKKTLATNVTRNPITLNAIKSITLLTNIKPTAKLVYSDHPQDPKIVAVVDRWSLFEVVVSSGLTVYRSKEVKID